jgi:ribosomal subunit interface protein
MEEPVVKSAVDGATMSKEVAMKTEIRGKHFEVSGRLREFIEKESEKLKQFYDPILDTRITLERENRMYRVEIVVHVHNHILKSTDEQDVVHPALGGAIDKMVRQLKRVKEKQRRPRVPATARD